MTTEPTTTPSPGPAPERRVPYGHPQHVLDDIAEFERDEDPGKLAALARDLLVDLESAKVAAWGRRHPAQEVPQPSELGHSPVILGRALVDRIAQAIGDPGSIAGRKLGSSWGEGNDGYAEPEETVTRWSTRAVLRVLEEAGAVPSLAAGRVLEAARAWREAARAKTGLVGPYNRAVIALDAAVDAMVGDRPEPAPAKPSRAERAYPRGDGPCSDCNTTDNIIWFTESVFWNHVIRQGDYVEPILCVPCFVARVHAAGLAPTGWRLLPEWHWETTAEYEARRRPEPAPAPVAADLTAPLGHAFVPVAGHPDDDECTHRSDGTDATYCGRTAADHEPVLEPDSDPGWDRKGIVHIANDHRLADWRKAQILALLADRDRLATGQAPGAVVAAWSAELNAARAELAELQQPSLSQGGPGWERGHLNTIADDLEREGKPVLAGMVRSLLRHFDARGRMLQRATVLADAVPGQPEPATSESEVSDVTS